MKSKSFWQSGHARKGKHLLSLLLSAALLIGSVPSGFGLQASAQTNPADEQLPITASGTSASTHDGYLFKIKQTRGSVMALQDFMPEKARAIKYNTNWYWAETEEELDALITAGLVEVVEENSYVTLFEDTATLLTNDPQYATYQAEYMTLIHQQAAWDLGVDGTGVKVAVIDSGLVVNQEDINYGNVLIGKNFLSDQGVADTRDTFGHGSFVSSVIACQTDNNLGIAGIADGVTLLPLRVFADANASVANILAAIGEARAQEADIINMSFGMSTVSTSLEDAINLAAADDIVLVAAAGNYGDEDNLLMYPAGYDNVIGVGAVTSAGTVATFSQHNAGVYLTAPGALLRGVDHTGTTLYRLGSGTSYAAPIITGVAALALQIDPTLLPEELMSLMSTWVTDSGTPGYDFYYGHGIIDVAKMIDALDDFDTSLHSLSVLDVGATVDPLDPHHYYVILPAGTDLAAITDTDLHILPTSLYATVSPPIQSLDKTYWSFTVTSGDNTIQTDYTVDLLVNESPYVVAGQSSQIGTATLASLDGLTAAVPYEEAVTAWFTDADGDPLTYVIVSSSGQGEATLNNGLLHYDPALADAGTNVSLVLKANDGMEDSTSNVTVTLTIGALPVSHATLDPSTVAFDLNPYSATHADVPVNVTTYGNTLTGITIKPAGSVDEGTVVEETAYTYVEETPETSAAIHHLTMKTDWLKTLAVGTYTLALAFDAGNAATLTLTINDTFIAVTDIADLQDTAYLGVPLPLTGTVSPANATHTTITWSVADANGTGATITNGSLSATTLGTASLRATISGGLRDSDFTKDFDITVLHPLQVNAGEETQTGTATPASLDGLTATIPGVQDMSDWFTDATGAALTYAVVSSSGDGEADISGSELTYTPATTDAASDVTLVLKANNGVMDSATNVTLTITVGVLPPSNASADSVIATYDLNPYGADHGNAGITISTYGNVKTAITFEVSGDPGDPDALDEANYSYVAVEPDDGTGSFAFTLLASWMETLPPDNYEIVLNFDVGEPVTILLDVVNTFIAVTDITNLPASMTAGTPKTLSGTVTPADATRKTITWSVVSAGGTGASISGSTLTATAAGTATLRATISGGISGGDFTKDFDVTVAAAVVVPDSGGGDTGGGAVVGGGGGVPMPAPLPAAPPEEELVLTAAGAPVTVTYTEEDGQLDLHMSEETLDALTAAATVAATTTGGTGTAGMVSLDLSGVPGISAASVPANALAHFASAAAQGEIAGVQLTLPGGSVTLNPLLLQELSALADMLDAQNGASNAPAAALSILPVLSETLTPAQRAQVGTQPVFELSLSVGDTAVHTFNGQASFTLPYTLRPGQNGAGVVIWHLAEDGSLQPIPAVYSGMTGTVTFTVSHLSTFAIGYDPLLGWKNPFSDVAAASWFYEAVRYVNHQGLFSGTGAASFSPGMEMNRAMFVTVLGRLSAHQGLLNPTVGTMTPNGTNETGESGGTDGTVASTLPAFSDVPDGQWYSAHVAWAVAAGITSGLGDGRFAPDMPVTREQMAVMLYQYAGMAGQERSTTGSLSAFADANQVSGWADTAMRWAVAKGLITGKSGGRLDPGGKATRAEVAVILMRYAQGQ